MPTDLRVLDPNDVQAGYLTEGIWINPARLHTCRKRWSSDAVQPCQLTGPTDAAAVRALRGRAPTQTGIVNRDTVRGAMLRPTVTTDNPSTAHHVPPRDAMLNPKHPLTLNEDARFIGMARSTAPLALPAAAPECDTCASP